MCAVEVVSRRRVLGAATWEAVWEEAWGVAVEEAAAAAATTSPQTPW